MCHVLHETQTTKWENPMYLFCFLSWGIENDDFQGCFLFLSLENFTFEALKSDVSNIQQF